MIRLPPVSTRTDNRSPYTTHFRSELCAEFGATLPRLRKRVAQDLRRRRMDKARAVAAGVRLLDLGFVRVGSECYVTANKSYGATTLRKRHADVDGRVLKLEYNAKSGKMRQLAIADGSLIRFVRNCDDLPGQDRKSTRLNSSH